jgi:hypothetical protein
MNFVFIDKNFEKIGIASSSLIYLDGRLSNFNKILMAKNAEFYKSIKKIAVYIAPFKNSEYCQKSGKYFYKKGLIKL